MTNDDIELDDDWDAPVTQSRVSLEQVALLVSATLALVGLVGYATIRLGLIPSGFAVPHLLGASVFALGLGAGAFALLFNTFTNPVVTRSNATKAGTVYALVLVLVSLFVDAGAFHPRLAVVFLMFLTAGGVLYALFRSEAGFSFLAA